MAELLKETTEIKPLDIAADVKSLQDKIAVVQSYKTFVSAKENEKSVSDSALAYWDSVAVKTKDPEVLAYRKKIAENPKWYAELRAREAQMTLDVLTKQIETISAEVVK